MARATVDGIGLDYELLGDAGAPAIAVTPGGRFARDSKGVPELGRALADGGRRVLMWDRPNCGASDISFDGPSESALAARCLIGLIDALDLGPTALAAGSAGSRVSLIAAASAPEKISHLTLWWISGGALSLASLAYYYTFDHANAAAIGGMEAVAKLPGWAEQIERNPRNRDILLALEPRVFIDRMEHWARAYAYSDASPVPGMAPGDFARLTMPTLIWRSGDSDISHTRRTSEWVHELIPGSELREPPWGDQEWNERSAARNAGQGALFENWPRLAPDILAFTG